MYVAIIITILATGPNIWESRPMPYADCLAEVYRMRLATQRPAGIGCIEPQALQHMKRALGVQ